MISTTIARAGHHPTAATCSGLSSRYHNSLTPHIESSARVFRHSSASHLATCDRWFVLCLCCEVYIVQKKTKWLEDFLILVSLSSLARWVFINLLLSFVLFKCFLIIVLILLMEKLSIFSVNLSFITFANLKVSEFIFMTLFGPIFKNVQN